MPEKIIPPPNVLNGKLKEAVLSKYSLNGFKKSNFKLYNFQGDTLYGSNVPLTGYINKILGGLHFRVAVPTDKVYEEISLLLEGKYYTDFNAIDVRGKRPHKEDNAWLWKKIIEIAEKDLGRSPKFPFRVQGFCCAPDKNERGYNVNIAPMEDFRVIEDERINLPNGTRFNTLDKNGIINPHKNGKFKWHSSEDGLTRVCLANDNSFNSWNRSIISSFEDGRIIVCKK